MHRQIHDNGESDLQGSDAPARSTTQTTRSLEEYPSKKRRIRVEAASDGKYKTAHSISGHENGIASVKISPCGNFICSGGSDGKALLMDLNSGRFLRMSRTADTAGSNRFKAAGISDVAWHNSSDYVCTATDDNCAYLFDAESGALMLGLGNRSTNYATS